MTFEIPKVSFNLPHFKCVSNKLVWLLPFNGNNIIRYLIETIGRFREDFDSLGVIPNQSEKPNSSNHGFIDNEDFLTILSKNGGGRPLQDFFLTILG